MICSTLLTLISLINLHLCDNPDIMTDIQVFNQVVVKLQQRALRAGKKTNKTLTNVKERVKHSKKKKKKKKKDKERRFKMRQISLE